MSDQTIHIVGGGLVGPLAAIYLARKGFQIELHERRPDMRKTGAAGGRSINLAVSSRGLMALEEVGLRDKITPITIPMRGRMVHDPAGKTDFIPYGQNEGEHINAMSRGLLNIALLDAADTYKNITTRFGRHCTGYDATSAILSFADGATVEAGIVIAADGAWSAIRKSMLDQVHNFNYAQDFLEHAYKELVIPPGAADRFLMEKNALHVWPRKNYMLMALPNTDGSFTCTLFFPYEGPESFASLKTRDDVTTFFNRVFPDAVPLMPTLADDFFANPTGALCTIRCAPWNIGGKALLIGDAAHAIVPFYGQGMNCGFEDCRILASMIGSSNPDWGKIFADFGKRRKPDADAIAAMALDIFVEQRDGVTDPKFPLKKAIGFELEKKFPGRFIPRYAMVAFHPEIPYAEARRLGDAQERLLASLCDNINSIDQVDWARAEALVKRQA